MDAFADGPAAQSPLFNEFLDFSISQIKICASKGDNWIHMPIAAIDKPFVPELVKELLRQAYYTKYNEFESILFVSW